MRSYLRTRIGRFAVSAFFLVIPRRSARPPYIAPSKHTFDRAKLIGVFRIALGKVRNGNTKPAAATINYVGVTVLVGHSQRNNLYWAVYICRNRSLRGGIAERGLIKYLLWSITVIPWFEVCTSIFFRHRHAGVVDCHVVLTPKCT